MKDTTHPEITTSKRNIDREVLLKMYDEANNHIRSTMESFYKAKNFYTSTILAIIGSSLFLVKESLAKGENGIAIDGSIISVLGFLIGGVLVLGLCIIGYGVMYSHYRTLLEKIVVTAKIEDLLELNKDDYRGINYWKNESLVIDRHLEGRASYPNSSEFVTAYLKKGSLMKSGRLLFYVLGGIGSFFILISIFLMF